jgi:serine/threonine protein kinase
MSTPLPFSESEVIEAFPDLHVHMPELGRGSFKVAYLARDEAGSRVLKILTDPFGEEDEAGEGQLPGLPERLARELSGMAEVNSPHVVKIISEPKRISIGGSDYIVYEEPYYSGGTLADRIASGPLSPEEVEQLVIALLRGVQDLWDQRHIVHRDIKPGNIAFDSDGNPVLLDLGIALYSDLSGLTQSNAASPMTTIYAAPEQFEMRRFATIDFRTDLFQIGIVAFIALTGQHPFLHEGVTDVASYIDKLFQDIPVDVSGLDCSEELRTVLSRLLEHQPNRRYRVIRQPLAILEGL